MSDKRKKGIRIGPGVLVAAAFIGPGTVATAMRAGVSTSFSLLWALLLSLIATVFLQEMAGRLGIVTQTGLATQLKKSIKPKGLRMLVLALVLSAIVIGNLAYEAGNLSGAVLGLEALLGREYLNFYPYICGGLALAILAVSKRKYLERIFMTLVLVMSFSFLLTAILTEPNPVELLQGLLIPEFSSDQLYLIIALIGTTVVPYNLFLYASLARDKWKAPRDLREMRHDIRVSVLLGGIISMSIVISAAILPGSEINSVLDLAAGLEPLYGSWAKMAIGLGLFAAGITSSITAPLAAAYVVSQIVRDSKRDAGWIFKGVGFSIVLLGMLGLILNFRPLQLIQFAQVANGLLLPLIAILLVWVMNQKKVLGAYVNGKFQNILALLIIILVLILGIRSVFGF